MNRVAIICVDDAEIILKSLGNQLKRSLGQDYTIELASSGEQAIDLCAELTASGIAIALVISDQTMPGISGDELLIKLHTIYPKALKILLTGQAGVNSVANLVNAGALYRYIAKPWDETDLILTIKEALKSYGQEKLLAKQNNLLKKTNKSLKKSNLKLLRSLDLLLATLEAADDGILVLDNQGKVVVFNQRFLSIWKILPSSMMEDANHLLGLISRRITEPFACDLNQEESQKCNLLKLVNGKILECYSQPQQLEGNNVGTVWGFRDVTSQEQDKAIAKQKAQHDTLTELPKRTILTCQISEAITKNQKNSHQLAVIFVGLDRFKIISDTLGHKIGDILLKKVVQRLKKCIREEDVIARWGNNEFTLLLTKISYQNEATAISNRILDAFKFPFKINSQAVYVTIDIGIAMYPEHGLDAETLLKNADSALSQAQQQLGRHNYQYYNATFADQAHKLLTLDNLLHSALQKEEFVLHYQPIVNVLTGKIVKMEALLRWQNPQQGLVSPYIFIPLAEENGSIVPIGEWVIKTACTQNKTWQTMGLMPITMSVNLSACQFRQPNLLPTIALILEQTQLQPSYLELEITESITMENTKSSKAILQQLNDLGITLSMDDFGTGYSSLGYLKQFPFHTLKIDRSFVKDLHANSQDMAIVNAVITLGKGLNLNVVAEGVETEELWDLLKNLGCEYIQGYLFSKPLPAAEATKLLQKYQ